MRALFNLVIFQPIFNLFVGLYALIPDVGVAIILLTVLIKIILTPLTNKGIRAQASMAELQPKLEGLKRQHKDNPQLLAQETMKLYKEHKVNPVGSCLPLLIQLPVFIALYWVLQAGLANGSLDQLYSFVPNPGKINPISLGFFDLSKRSIGLAVLAGAAQFWQAKMMVRTRPPKPTPEGAKDEDMMAIMNKQMLYMMPILTVVIGISLPAGLSLYWFVSTVLTGLQQLWLQKKHQPPTAPGVIDGKIV